MTCNRIAGLGLEDTPDLSLLTGNSERRSRERASQIVCLQVNIDSLGML